MTPNRPLVGHNRGEPYAAAKLLIALWIDDLTVTGPTARIATPMTMAMKKRVLFAFLLSAWQPGLGQLYAGRALRALIFCSSYTGVAAVFFYGIFGRSLAGAVTFVVLVVTIRLCSAVDAGLLVRSASDSRRWFQRWYVCVPLGIVFAIAFVPLLASIQNLKSYYIPSVAMEPTLMVGDRLIADLDAYAVAPPGRGDIVIVRSPEDPTVELIKRVVAVGGDTVELRGKTLYLNGAAIDEPWVVHLDPTMASRDNPMSRRFSRDHMAPLAVPEGHLFLMGDNRDFSYDSRFIGTVPVASVHGAPLYVYWSPHRNRIGIKLDSYATAA